MPGLHAVAAHWAELPAREQRILLIRFYGDLTQSHIGAAAGPSLGLLERKGCRLRAARPRKLKEA